MPVYFDIRKLVIIIMTAFLIGLVHEPSASLDDAGSLRCNQESSMSGDTEFQVKTACGEPESILIKGFAKKVWIYNFGPTRFIYYLTFVNGGLERIQVGEYGDYHGNRNID
jgi:hypothetical protein